MFNKMKTRNIVRMVTFVPLGLLILYSIYYALTHDPHPRYKDCGVVVSKSNDEVPIKHGSKTELYLNIQFDKSGFRSIECEPTTYFKYQKDERVCFNLRQKTSVSHIIYTLIGWVVMFIGGLIWLVLFVMYLTGNL
jgi:hypothetical protein